MSEEKHDKKITKDAHTGSKKHEKSEGPAHIAPEEAMNRGEPGKNERHKGQSPPARSDKQDETVVWQTTAQETNPDPQHGSAATSARKSGIPAQPETPPSHEQSEKKEKDKSESKKKGSDD